MNSKIEYIMGDTPTESGTYLTIRKSRINDGMEYVDLNVYDTNYKRWLFASPDTCDIIAYFPVNKIIINH